MWPVAATRIDIVRCFFHAALRGEKRRVGVESEVGKGRDFANHDSIVCFGVEFGRSRVCGLGLMVSGFEFEAQDV